MITYQFLGAILLAFMIGIIVATIFQKVIKRAMNSAVEDFKAMQMEGMISIGSVESQFKSIDPIIAQEISPSVAPAAVAPAPAAVDPAPAAVAPAPVATAPAAVAPSA